MAQNEANKGVLPQIIVAVVVALLVGGTSPWWWNEIFDKKKEINQVIQEPPKVIEISEFPSEGPPRDIARRVEELQGDLVNNENEQDRAHRGIERLRTMLENDPDALKAIEHQERLLGKLTMERERMEDELRRLREQR